MSNCVVGSGGSRLPCSTIAEHSVEGCDHFSHDGHDDDLGFFVGGDEAIVEGFEGGTVTACTDGGHVKDVTDRHPTTIDAAVSLELAAVEVIWCEGGDAGTTLRPARPSRLCRYSPKRTTPYAAPPHPSGPSTRRHRRKRAWPSSYPILADAGSCPGNCAGMEEATGAPSSFAVSHPRRLRASSHDGG